MTFLSKDDLAIIIEEQRGGEDHGTSYIRKKENN